MGTRRRRERQQGLWIATSDVVETPGNAFYDRLNQILDEHHFDERVERMCRKFYRKSSYGRPSIAPGIYFRSLLIGYFEGLDSERGIAWRMADSLSLRKFLGYALDETTPDHSTISRTRRLYWLETHKAVFRWVLKVLSEDGLIGGRTISIDATTLEANAALKSIVRRDMAVPIAMSPSVSASSNLGALSSLCRPSRSPAFGQAFAPSAISPWWASCCSMACVRARSCRSNSRI